MKKIKNILAFTLLSFLMINLGSSLAANTGDTGWSFNFGRSNFNLYTQARSKHDASPVYFYVDSIKGDVLKVRVLTGNKTVSSYTPVTYINKTGKYCLSSNVNEDGYSSALVHGSKYEIFSTLQSYGDWSPDSYSCDW